MCTRAATEDSPCAKEALTGLQAVLLAGETDVSEQEYPCHTPTMERWFASRITSIGDQNGGAVVSTHLDISWRKFATTDATPHLSASSLLELSAAGSPAGDISEEGVLSPGSTPDDGRRNRSGRRPAGREAGDDKGWLRLLVDGVRDYAIVGLDIAGRVTGWNVGEERITGYRSDEILGRHFSVFSTPEAQRAGEPAAERSALPGRQTSSRNCGSSQSDCRHLRPLDGSFSDG